MTPRSVEERNSLVTENEKLVGFTLDKFFSGKEWWKLGDKRDAAQIGRLALLKAAERWDPARKVKFSTLAVKYIQRAVLNCLMEGSLIHLPHSNWGSRKESYWESQEWIVTRALREEAKHFLPLGRATFLPDKRAGEEFQEFLRREDRNRLKWILQNGLDLLSYRESAVLTMRYFLSWRFGRIGRYWRITKERARQIHERALEKLRDHRGLREVWENLYE